MDAFFFEADYGALVRLVDRDLNTVLRRADRGRPFGRILPSVRVVPLAPVAMLVCAQTARIDAPGVGWVPEVDVGFWIPVLLLAKSGAARVPWKLGFSNLHLAGDWTRCGLDAGCVEAAAISGLLCAESVTGRPEPIEGHYEIARGSHAPRPVEA